MGRIRLNKAKKDDEIPLTAATLRALVRESVGDLEERVVTLEKDNHVMRTIVEDMAGAVALHLVETGSDEGDTHNLAEYMQQALNNSFKLSNLEKHEDVATSPVLIQAVHRLLASASHGRTMRELLDIQQSDTHGILDQEVIDDIARDAEDDIFDMDAEDYGMDENGIFPISI